MRQMRLFLSLILGSLSVFAPVATPGVDSAPSSSERVALLDPSTMRGILENFARAYNTAASRAKAPKMDTIGRNVVVVFLPGIPGSEILRRVHGRVKPVHIFGQDKVRAPFLFLPTDDPQLFIDGREILIETRLLREYRTYFGNANQYGRIMDRLNKSFGGKATSLVFSYDWRLDVKDLAAMLDVCLEGDLHADSTLESSLRRDCRRVRGKDVIIVAHSFGGLVAWWWQQELARGKDTQPDAARVRHVALLGSPLMGSCEMFKTLLRGYVPNEASFMERVGAAYFVGGLQPAAFTFPGAFQVLPYDPTNLTSCLELPRAGVPGASPEAAPIFSPEWWEGESYGADLLERLRPENELRMDQQRLHRLLENALTRAKVFRSDLDFTTAAVHGTYFYSDGYRTGGKALLELKEGRSALDDRALAFQEVWGDGRVPWEPIRDLRLEDLARTWRTQQLKSRHGALADDDDFLIWLDNEVTAVNLAAVAVKMVQKLSEDEGLKREFTRAGGQIIDPELVAAVLNEDAAEPPPPSAPVWLRVPVKSGDRQRSVSWNYSWRDIAWVDSRVGWLGGAIWEGSAYGDVGKGILLRTDDGGETWSERGEFKSGQGNFTWGPAWMGGTRPYRWSDVGPINALHFYGRHVGGGVERVEGWVAAATGIYRSLDAGMTWERVTPPPNHEDRYALFSNIADIEAFAEIYAVGWQGIAHGFAGGGWTVQKPTYTYPMMSVGLAGGSEDRNVWAVGASKPYGHGAIYRLVWPDNHWVPVDLPGIEFEEDKQLLDIAVRDLRTIFAVGAKGLVILGSRNGRDAPWSWARVATPSNADLRSVAVAGSDVWIVGSEGTILHSTNDGASWQTLKPLIGEDGKGVNLRRVRLAGDTAWILGEGVLLRAAGPDSRP